MADTDIDPALLVRMREGAPEMANAIVLAEYSERAAFAHQALAVKLRELDAALVARDRAAAAVAPGPHRLHHRHHRSQGIRLNPRI